MAGKVLADQEISIADECIVVLAAKELKDGRKGVGGSRD